MPDTPTFPGVYIDETPADRRIASAPTSVPVFIGSAAAGPLLEPIRLASWLEYLTLFGDGDPFGDTVRDFFANGGGPAWVVRSATGDPASGLAALERIDRFNLLCLPPAPGEDTPAEVYREALAVSAARRAILIVDPPAAWASANDAVVGIAALGLAGKAARNAALYFPRLAGQAAASGAIAGVIARTDAERGVWKASAGIEASLDVAGLAIDLTDAENGLLNPLGINCLRRFAPGPVIWGARTLAGADAQADDYKYLSVRRLALHIEESVIAGIEWAIFEANDERLWAALRLAIGAFLHDLFRQGAFQGSTPRDAWFVRCDASTTSQVDIERGIVNIFIGFAPLKPAEFVVIQIQQIALAC